MYIDRSWMKRRIIGGALTNEFMEGVKGFLDFAYSKTQYVSGDKIRCPCRRCNNLQFHCRDEVEYHLCSKGFISGYTQWIAHGELTSEEVDESSSIPQSESFDAPQNPYRTMVVDAIGIEGIGEERPNDEAAKFFELLNYADEPLWSGCKSQSRLSAMSQLLNCKSEFNMSEACYDRLMLIIKDMLPEDAKLEENFYKTKKMMKKLGLGYEKIDACQNNCMLFYKETTNLTQCSVCGHARYKPRLLNNGRRKNIPYKVLRYLPIAPRLQRLFMSEKTAKHMIWHAKNRTSDVVAHPAHSEAWKQFDAHHPSFASDPRNVRLGLCTDGFNPFGHSSIPYSVWPVLITVYNLPPSMCLKDQFMFLSLIIPGPKSPRKELDIFLRPLIDELNMLWSDGILTYDVFRKQNFQMRAALMWTISDFPAYAMLSGWSTHGRLACPYCLERSKAFVLENGRKISFFDCHRQFLPLDHPYRRQRDKFMKGRIERDIPPLRLSGDDIKARVDKLPDIQFGNQCINARISGFGQQHNWVKKSIFWSLPYWHTNLIRHNLDVMHIERNVFENIFNTVMDIKGKTKDNVKARADLPKYCKRPELELEHVNGKMLKPRASFVLNKEQIKAVCQWVKELKFPDGYASNISRCVNIDDCKFYGMKSHDCHVFMQRLIPIAFRDLLPDPVWDALTELSLFFRDLCSSVLRIEDVERLELNIVEILCKLEKIFPPSFFDSMEHLPVHLAYEAKIGGPVQYRWMYRFERYMLQLKKKVKNRAYVEGSICEAYIIEEISNFCSFYFEPKVHTRFNQVPRNDDGGVPTTMGRLSIFTYPGRPCGAVGRYRRVDENEYKAIELYVLMNCEEISPFIDEFNNIVMQRELHLTDAELEKLRDREFPKWLRDYVNHNIDTIDSRILAIAQGPQRFVRSMKGYFVNGYKFHTKEYSHGKKTINSGVCVKGSCYNDYDRDYYGILIDIVQVEYFGEGNQVVLFKCEWFDTEKGVRVHPRHGLVEINHKLKLYIDAPFVLAEQAQQVYYTSYPSKKKGRSDWWVACKIKARNRYEDIEEIDDNIPPHIDDFFQEDEVEAVQPIMPTTELDASNALVNVGVVDEVDQHEFFLRTQTHAIEEDEEEANDVDIEDEDTEDDEVDEYLSNEENDD